MDIRKLVLASILTALTVVIDISFKLVIPIQTIGTPFYAIPVIFAVITLGLKYGIIVAFLGDFIAVFLLSIPYFPLFSLASIMWGIIPIVIRKTKRSFLSIFLVLLLTHLFVSTINSIALMVHYHKSIQGLLVDLPLRLALIIPNTLVISLVLEAIFIATENKNNRFE